MIELSTGTLKSAYMTSSVAWHADIIMSLTSSGLFSGPWNYTVAFQPVTVSGEFTIRYVLQWLRTSGAANVFY
jgi:hypothetical protein